MALEWVCECGERWEEAGDGKALSGKVLTHLRLMKKAGTPHRVVGLVDSETGKVLVEGANAKGAVKAGLITYRPDPAVEEELSALSTGPRPRTLPTNIQGIVQGVRLAIPPAAWGYFALGIPILRRDDGSRYDWSPQGLSDYMWDVFRTWHEENMAVLLRLTPQQMRQPEVQERVRRIIAAIENLTPEQVAEIDAAATADVAAAGPGVESESGGE